MPRFPLGAERKFLQEFSGVARLASIFDDVGDTTLPEYLHIDDVARAFGVTRRTVTNWMARGYLPYYKLGNTVLMKRSEIENALNQRRFVGRKLKAEDLPTTGASELLFSRQAQTTYACGNGAQLRRRRIPWRRSSQNYHAAAA